MWIILGWTDHLAETLFQVRNFRDRLRTRSDTARASLFQQNIDSTAFIADPEEALRELSG
jgi:hypothetical protein